ncbi:M3 family metallopeptidase [Pseudomonas sp.]|uniref:M3 family metallopeptidase n=1 Tax=Pseudomonas sp. TaxID=306 RepID=UPI003BB65981
MPPTNPLLQHWILPVWCAVRAEHLAPAIDAIVTDNQRIIAEVIASQTDHPNWDDLVLAMDAADARLTETMAIIDLLSTVKPDDVDWIEQSALCSIKAARYRAQKSANQDLYRAYQRLQNSSIAASFDNDRQASLAKTLRALRLSGIDLPAEQQQQLAKVNRDINHQEQMFLTNLERASAAWSKQIAEEALLDGLSAAFKEHLALNARRAGQSGWLLTLNRNTFENLMKHARNRNLREEYFAAYCTRASDQGSHAQQFNNDPVLKKLLALRHEKARLLGFGNFAQLRLSTHMAASPDQVEYFLHQQIAQNSVALGQDTQALQAFAATQGINELHAWDHAFFAEQLRQQRSQHTLKGLRQYFPLEQTLRRFCRYNEHLFGIRFTEQNDLKHWHDQVQLLQVSEFGQVIGYIYIDPFHREDAADFAWTNTLRNRRINAEGRPTLPIAVLHCNFPRATAEHPCLLSHRDLRVLFHEFGHCLQQVLTRSPHHNLSGISQLGRDTGEFAGQLYEQFAMSAELLLWLSGHYQSGEPLSSGRLASALVAIAAHTSRDTAMLLQGALLDLELHRSAQADRSIQACFEAVQQKIPALQLPAYCRLANSFDYLVTGYEASVYAYKWSGVLATEAFKRIARDGVFNSQTGRDLREAFFSGDAALLPSALQTFLGQPLRADLFAPVPK